MGVPYQWYKYHFLYTAVYSRSYDVLIQLACCSVSDFGARDLLSPIC